MSDRTPLRRRAPRPPEPYTFDRRSLPGMTIDERGGSTAWVSWIVGLGLAALVTGGVIWHARAAAVPLWSVASVEVEGNRSLTEREVMAAVGLQPGLPWWSLRPRLDRLQELEPRVRGVSLGYAFPRGLRVRLEEREAILLVAGESLLVLSRDGVLLQPDAALDPTDLPCLTGSALGPGAQLHTGQHLQVREGDGWLAQLLKVRDEQPELWHSLSQIEVIGQRELRLFFREGRRILLWDPELNDHLWPQIPRILAGLAAHDLADDAVLDMRFRDRVVVRYPEGDAHRLDPAAAEGQS